MAEAVVSAVISFLVENLTSKALKAIVPHNGIDADIKKWHKLLTQIQDVLADASRKEITSQAVRRWLNDLQHLAYEIDDVLDDLATDAMEREFTPESEASSSKVIKLFSGVFTKFPKNTKMLDKLDSINAKLQELLKQKADLGLSDEPRTKNNKNRIQSSVVDPSRIVGRQAEKEAFVKLLLQEDGPSHQNFGIVPIFGMGGVGKTTLAKLLYNDPQIEKHFPLKGWVCISDEFDIVGRTKDIFKDLGGELKDEHDDLNKLHEALRDYVRGKRFLLVLDDVWFESYTDWQNLVEPLFTCAPESKIVITTRKDQLLRRLGYDPLNKQLECLSCDDALSLFALHALGVKNFDSHLSLKSHGEGIVKKCGRLPLALIALGTSLRTKEDEYSWKGMLESEIWNLPVEGEILPALRLSYHELSAPLKQVFAYCSLFPKDFLFDKKELVLLWMAEGFLHQSTQRDSTEEMLGREYFEDLLSRSFFQYAPNNESLFVMHDLMNDLATHVAGEFFVRFDIEAKKDINERMLEKYRHMSFVREKFVTYKKLEAFKRSKSLRTFLATSVGEVDKWQVFYLSNKIVVDLLSKLPLLRVLSLSNFDKLPNSFSKLKNLRHLDIDGTMFLNQMPLGIGELKSLETLSRIIIGGINGFEITKLKDFEYLRGEVSIEDLDKVQNATNARVANFPQKKISKLKVVWSNVWDDSRNKMLEKDVLNELKPHNDKLIELEIRFYGGSKFPNWVGDPLFVHLKHVSLSYCKRCTSLPPLAQLQSLKKLTIEHLDGVEDVGTELLGTCRAFPSLEILSFLGMSKWEKWSINNVEDAFPCLKQLVIKDCPNLVEVTLEKILTLKFLKLENCDCGVLRRLVEVASSVTKLEINNILGLNDVVWKGVIEHIVAVEELHIARCNEIRYLWESEAVASKVLVNLRELKVMGCHNLVSLGEKEYDGDRNLQIASLRNLIILMCNNMERCSCTDNIENLSIRNCRSITSISLPTEFKSLSIMKCEKLFKMRWGGQNNNNKSSMPMLFEHVHIRELPNLESIIGLNYLVHLTQLVIEDCKGLESLPDNEFPKLTLLKSLHIRNCPEMNDCFPRGLWPPNLQALVIGRLKKPISKWGSQNFPSSLVKLSLYDGGEDGVSSCSQFSNLLPSSLTSLELWGFEKLESFSMGLQHLQRLSFGCCPNLHKFSHPQHLTNSLQHLTFFKCPNMKDLPEQLLPSLLSLEIRHGGPNMKERCSKGGSYWALISHIPNLDIYNPEIRSYGKLIEIKPHYGQFPWNWNSGSHRPRVSCDLPDPVD
ncbi:hypothetical protein E3N88_07964 [Mikania micrantha]|uniref:NB-ARC domain-containing protein n=1 Tax=Mikania micrantha TaxID=192012 RepID=A0A5N6PEX4_9ASTR|nr:hypothetical protein E3N88_07964 [Mikania micrantha]